MKAFLHAPAFCLLAALCNAAQADTLREIYELALENDAQLKAAEATYNANLEVERVGLSALLPQVNGNYRYTDSDTDTDAESVEFSTGSPVPIDVSTNLDIDNKGYEVALQQALFDLPAWFNFREGAQRSKEAEATFAADQQDLIVRVVETYLGVLRAQDNLEASQARERAFKRQLEQTQQRFEVGLIAITDVHEAQAGYDLARVERITDENDLNVATERLSVLTGRYHDNLYVLRSDFNIKPPVPAERADWVDFALEHNYRLSAAKYAEEAARNNSREFAAQHLPTVTGSASYSDFETRGDRTENPPSVFNLSPDQDQDRTVYEVRVDVPLFSGGRVSAQRRQAAQQFIATRENRINLMRNTVTDTRSLHMTVINDVARVNARRLSIVSSQSALDATTAGYEVGTRNVVDVLNAQNTLFEAKRDYANARYDYVNSLLRLKQQAGLLSPEDIYRLDSELVAPAAPTASSRAGRSPYPTE
jgi:outer membrane protein